MKSPAPRRALRRTLAAVVSTAVALGLATTGATVATAATPPTAPDADNGSSFILPVLPDTQFYSRYSASQFSPKYGTNPFEVQTQWIVDNQRELNMPFAVHVGDVVDQQGVTGEWEAADKAMDMLTAGGVPYSILPGNHDVSDMNARSSTGISANYRARFGASAMAAQSAATGSTLLGTFQDGLSSAYLFEAEGHTWMSLAIAWNASDDTFAWAQGILDQNKGIPVVLSSHAIINIAADQASPASWWWGDLLWDRLIRKNDQIMLTVNGHFHGATKRTLTNDFGHPVHQILTDYQMAADGGNGILTLFEFDLSNQKIDVESVSPWVTKKDAGSRASSDTPVLTGPSQSFSFAFDFNGRFGWTTDAAEENNADLSKRAKEIVSEGWVGGDGSGTRADAGAPSDYPQVDGTVAHWRFGDVATGVVDETTVIPDVAGSSPMYRNAVDTTDHPELLEDVNVTHTNRALYSADPGAICFTGATRNPSGPDRLSYITTEYGAPATFVDLNAEDGYTIETFLQLDASWTESANRWSAALTRGGSRAWTGIADSSDPGAGVAWLGISSLREYQYSAATSDRGQSYTLWSGEIMQSAWHHVAIVNDPIADTAIMYVDGVPVLRNASQVGGMMASNFMPWIIGASTWDSEPEHGWNGCVGETRIVDHALKADQFLYNRVDIDATGAGFAVTTDLASVYPHDSRIASLSGRGHAGASVRVESDGVLLGKAEVAADGTWTVALTEPLAGSGSYGLSFVQSIGSRDGKALDAVVVIGEDAGWTPAESDLAADLEGKIAVTPNPFVAGAELTVAVPAGHEGETVHVFAFSTPAVLGTGTVGSGSTLRVSTPSSLALGEHRVAVYSAAGDVLGWQRVTVQAPAVEEPVIIPIDQPIEGGPVSQEPPRGGVSALAVTGVSVLGTLLVAAGALIVGGILRSRRGRRAD
ncbi:metallophosphoesterase [Microbacterium sp. cx-55]|uniref:LamG-like jellyroll fold domain-containing protein n=1 Tax=Microbacterium sp. cx-55 TaxID=2875948 RepID=UPI001CC149D3|nr:LamG-like jellyroll fold domain-containing protein [Microbacterium sp. cx-55]MBZ4486811.1 metallophosphoesterase [Microbacterium sp. cx-55]UGB35741.1 metallophosphoesterase [Microbacterium sp. cx-55]